MGTAIPPECLVVNADEGNVVEEEGSKRGSLPVHHLNRDFFLCDLFDYALKDDSVSIEAPIFTLATKPTRRSGTGNPTACRCALHHKLFDLGVFTVEPTEYRIVFSQRAISGGRGMSGELQFHGQPIHAPQHTDLRPARVFLAWNTKNVFKTPARQVATLGYAPRSTLNSRKSRAGSGM